MNTETADEVVRSEETEDQVVQSEETANAADKVLLPLQERRNAAEGLSSEEAMRAWHELMGLEVAPPSPGLDACEQGPRPPQSAPHPRLLGPRPPPVRPPARLLGPRPPAEPPTEQQLLQWGVRLP